MRISLFITAACLLIAGAGVVVGQRSEAMTMIVGAQPEATRVADVTPGMSGIQTWTRMMELGGLENFGKDPKDDSSIHSTGWLRTQDGRR